jgi:hypothetical protein
MTKPDHWPPKGTKLTREDRQHVPVIYVFANGTSCQGSADAIFLKRPVPYAARDNDGKLTGHIVRGIYFDHLCWPASFGPYPDCASWRPPQLDSYCTNGDAIRLIMRECGLEFDELAAAKLINK